MESILKEFAAGNLSPQYRTFSQGSEYGRAMRALCGREEAQKRGYKSLRVYCDDGISGVTEKRPGYRKMLKDVEDGIDADEGDDELAPFRSLMNESYESYCKGCFG